MTSLDGKTLLLTRAEGDADSWASTIEARGGRALHLPCIRCEPAGDPGTGASLRSALSDCDWLVLTSSRGAAAAAALIGAPLPAGVRVAAVGEATGQACLDHLGRCDLVPQEGTGAALARALLDELRRDGDPSRARVLAAAADRAERHLEEVLEPAGVWVTRLCVYRTSPAPPLASRRSLDAMGIDYVLLASPSAARGLLNQVELPTGVHVLSIGPTTTRACRELGLDVLEAARPDLDSMLELAR